MSRGESNAVDRSCTVFMGETGCGKSRRCNLITAKCCCGYASYFPSSDASVAGSSRADRSEYRSVVTKSGIVIDLPGGENAESVNSLKFVLNKLREHPEEYLKLSLVFCTRRTRYVDKVSDFMDQLMLLDPRLLEYLRVEVTNCTYVGPFALLYDVTSVGSAEGVVDPIKKTRLWNLYVNGKLKFNNLPPPSQNYKLTVYADPPRPLIEMKIDGVDIPLSLEDKKDILSNLSASCDFLNDPDYFFRGNEKLNKGFLKSLKCFFKGSHLSEEMKVNFTCESPCCSNLVAKLMSCGHMSCHKHSTGCTEHPTSKPVQNVVGVSSAFCDFCVWFKDNGANYKINKNDDLIVYLTASKMLGKLEILKKTILEPSNLEIVLSECKAILLKRGVKL